MTTTEHVEPIATEEEAQMAKTALRCLSSALDHSHAARIALLDENGALTDAPVLTLPPQALHLFAAILKRMAQRQPVVLMPPRHELTTQEAAAYLNVSRPFVIKEIEAGRLACKKVNRHRRIEFAVLEAYRRRQEQQSDEAMKKLADLSGRLELDF